MIKRNETKEYKVLDGATIVPGSLVVKLYFIHTAMQTNQT